MGRKISQLPPANGLSDENLLEVVRYAQSQKLTARQLRQYLEQRLGTAAFADRFGTMESGAIMARGENARGNYLQLADGTLFTWGTQTFTGDCPPGQSVVWDTSLQPVPFVGRALHSISICFFTQIRGEGQSLYSVTQNYGTAAGDMVAAALNTGQTPEFVHPGFTLGTLVAKSYRVFFQSSGRWM